MVPPTLFPRWPVPRTSGREECSSTPTQPTSPRAHTGQACPAAGLCMDMYVLGEVTCFPRAPGRRLLAQDEAGTLFGSLAHSLRVGTPHPTGAPGDWGPLHAWLPFLQSNPVPSSAVLGPSTHPSPAHQCGRRLPPAEVRGLGNQERGQGEVGCRWPIRCLWVN